MYQHLSVAVKIGSVVLMVAGWLCPPTALGADDAPLRESAAKALRKATDFFRTQVATEGGYLWRYSEDLTLREGENKATATQVWVQPPGTPAVGLAYLTAFRATGDAVYLEAARDTAQALVKGQLRSGGWDYSIDFDPQQRKRYAYRVAPSHDEGRNSSTLDDNNTQAALRLLMRVDQALQFKDAKIHEAVEVALTSLLKVQYPNGAWPQRFEQPPDPEKFPVRKAAYPDTWSRTWPGSNYRDHYTFNDSSIADVMDVLLEAERTYGEKKYKAAVAKAGDFILLAQMPDPQPGWAQQYDADMHPAWARKFEPPAVTGGESQRIMRTLLRLYRETADKKYLEPLPRAIEYYRKSKLPDGRLARFYELKTNKPLYFTKEYQLTYSDEDLPTHYGFKVANTIEEIATDYEHLRALDPGQLQKPPKSSRPSLSETLTERTKKVVAALDERGRWVEDGQLRSHGPDDATRRIIACQTFIQNVTILSNYLAATKP